MDVSLISRIQFAVTIGFHFLFPPITIGLAWLLVIVEGLAWRTKDQAFEQLGRFFARLLGLTFAIGVASGIVMEFQFGTNWARYSTLVGDIFGAPLAAEALLAFFLESVFLGFYLFARNRVSRGVHWVSILLVALGATLSAFWILVANSWMHTPAGYFFNPQTERAELASFAQAVFNPSTLIRFYHTLAACLVCGAFFMGGACAYLLLRQMRRDAECRDRGVEQMACKGLRVALIMGFAGSVLVVYPSGHHHAKQVARDQPAKFAAMEGLYASRSRAPLVVFAVPFGEPPSLKAKVEVEGLLSWMAFGDVNARVRGIDEFPADERPPLWLTFVSFHNMVLLGGLFIVITAYGLVGLRRDRILRQRWYLRVLVVAVPLPLAACQLGWVAAEVGRQPWIVQGIMRTDQAFSSNLTAGQVLASLSVFCVVYLALLAMYLKVLFGKLRHIRIGPVEPVAPGHTGRAARS